VEVISREAAAMPNVVLYMPTFITVIRDLPLEDLHIAQ